MTVIDLLKNISKKLTAEVAIFPLATFRVVFGTLMLFSTLRFWYYGWIEDFYTAPTHFFSYFGQEWILPYNETFIYGLFIIMALSATGIMLGLFFRVCSLLFFISFTYVELIDKTTYLNHYYFVSLMAFLLLLTPAHRALSLDAKLFPRIRSFVVPRWSILALQCQIAILYLFAGIAKLNYDWLFNAQPMGLWLKSKADFPLLGELFVLPETAFVFSWAGMLFDISIAFFLFSKKLRPLGYLVVVVFHLLTWFLFPIGVFPWVMIGVTLVFFSSEWHERLWSLFEIRDLACRQAGLKFEISDSNPTKLSVRDSLFSVSDSNTGAGSPLHGDVLSETPWSRSRVRGKRGLSGVLYSNTQTKSSPSPSNSYRNQLSLRERLSSTVLFPVLLAGNAKSKIYNSPFIIYNLKSSLLFLVLSTYFTIQLIVPMRYALNDENLYWTENGYRFSWRVMLMEKTGHLEFRVKDIATQKESLVSPSQYFTAFQQRQLVTQPDMILQAAHIIAQDFKNRGMLVEVYADSYASLNGQKHRTFVNPEVNLASLKKDHKRDWIVQYD
ncbi:MAG: HTTM domain-containing protein [Flavobacteriales bacterium]